MCVGWWLWKQNLYQVYCLCYWHKLQGDYLQHAIKIRQNTSMDARVRGWDWVGQAGVNTLRPRQNGHHFAEDIFNAFSWMKMFQLRLKFHRSLFPRVQLTIFQHWFRLWLVAWPAPSHNLNQCWNIVNGLAPSRQQAIIWTNDGQFTDTYMRHSTSMS